MRDYLAVSTSRPQTRALAAISGLWMSRLVGFAAKTCLFDTVAACDGDPAEIARATGLAIDPLVRALEGLVHLGFLAKADERYALTDTGRLLCAGPDGGFRDMAVLWNDYFDGAWSELDTTLRTGQSGFEAHFGEPLFARIGRDPAAAKHFDAAMRGLSRLIAQEASAAIAARVRAIGHSSICDVGGGDGTLIAALAGQNPALQCLLFEQPHVVGANAAALKKRDVATAGGSFFESVPEADAHILSNVLHDWSDDDALRILKTVRQAQTPRSTLFVLEMMLGGDSEPLLARSTDLNMMVLTGGRERTKCAFEALLHAAGYRIIGVQPLAELTCLLEAVPEP